MEAATHAYHVYAWDAERALDDHCACCKLLMLPFAAVVASACSPWERLPNVLDLLPRVELQLCAIDRTSSRRISILFVVTEIDAFFTDRALRGNVSARSDLVFRPILHFTLILYVLVVPLDAASSPASHYLKSSSVDESDHTIDDHTITSDHNSGTDQVEMARIGLFAVLSTLAAGTVRSGRLKRCSVDLRSQTTK